MTSVEYALMGLRDGIAMRSELRKRLPKKPTMSEPIVMYQYSEQPELFSLAEFKRNFAALPMPEYFLAQNMEYIIAKWKIYLK